MQLLNQKEYVNVIDKDRHSRLLDAMPTIIKQTNVPEFYIKHSAVGNCDEMDLAMLKTYHNAIDQGIYGYCKVGGTGASRKLLFMAGAFIRNYVDARVYSLESALEHDLENISVLIIPDFCLSDASANPMVSWKVQQVYDLLMTRMSKGKYTILYAHDYSNVLPTFGLGIKDFIETNYIIEGR